MTNINKIGFWAALVAAGGSAAYALVQVMQMVDILTFPWGQIAIYGTSLIIPLPFILAMAALYQVTPVQAEDKKIYALTALLLSGIYGAFVAFNYLVQLLTVLPAQMAGQGAAVAALDQTPHSLFWAVDGMGYLTLGLATLLASAVFPATRRGRWARRFFLWNFLMDPVIAYVYFAPAFSEQLLVLAFPWAFTATGSMLMLGLWFREREGIDMGAK